MGLFPCAGDGMTQEGSVSIRSSDKWGPHSYLLCLSQCKNAGLLQQT